jgi:putative membrane protein
MRILVFAISLTALIPASPAAQIGNPAGFAPATPLSAPGKPAATYPNTQDRLFVQLAANGGNSEVQAAKLASSRAQNPNVARFARMMEEEHAKANQRLGALAGKADIPVPKEPDPEQKAVLAELDPLTGAQFDRAYMQAQLVGHQKMTQILQWEMSNGQASGLQQFAAETLLSVLHHLQMVQTIMAELNGSAPQGIARNSH